MDQFKSVELVLVKPKSSSKTVSEVEVDRSEPVVPAEQEATGWTDSETEKPTSEKDLQVNRRYKTLSNIKSVYVEFKFFTPTSISMYASYSELHLQEITITAYHQPAFPNRVSE